jgi:hypothetical protein
MRSEDPAEDTESAYLEQRLRTEEEVDAAFFLVLVALGVACMVIAVLMP